MRSIRAILVWLALTASWALTAQQDLSSYIKTSPLLTEEQRTRALEWMTETEAKNGAETKKKLNSCTVATSAISSVSLKLFPMLNGTPLILVLDAIESPTADTQLRAYSPSWAELPDLKLFAEAPSRSLLLQRWAIADPFVVQRVEHLLYPLHLEMKWVAGAEDLLSIRPVLPLSLSDLEQTSLVEANERRPELIYRWDGSVFQLQEKGSIKGN